VTAEAREKALDLLAGFRMTAPPPMSMASGRPRLPEPGVSGQVEAAAVAHRLGIG
jgi:hypothetical protein